jgi:hypothetical protein
VGIPGEKTSLYWLVAVAFDVKDAALSAYRAESSEIKSYYAIQPEYACVSKIGDDVAVEGGELHQSKAWIIVGEGGGRYLLLRQGGYRRIATGKLSTSPVASLSANCPIGSG